MAKEAVKKEERKNALTLEESFEKLDEILNELEAPDISLEDSFRVYKEGMELLKNCNETIDKVEKKVLKLNESGELEELL